MNTPFEHLVQAYGISHGQAEITSQVYFSSPNNLRMLNAILHLGIHSAVLSESVRQHMVENQRLNKQEMKQQCAKVLIHLTFIINELGFTLEEVKEGVMNSAPTQEYSQHKQYKPHFTKLPGMSGEGLIET